jgi:hypothetical protein
MEAEGLESLHLDCIYRGLATPASVRKPIA